jgi:drug/metabolite transporter (DMT)-like permease
MDAGSARRDTTLGSLAALLAAASSAATPTFAKLALGEGGEPLRLAAGRAAVGSLCLWILAAVGKDVRIDRRAAPFIAGATILFAGQSAFLLLALERSPAAIVTLLVYSYPVIVACLSLAVGRERLHPTRSAALGLGSMGVALVVGAPVVDITVAGTAAALASALLFAGYLVVVDAAPAGSPTTIGAVVTTGTAISLAAVGLATDGLGPSPAVWGGPWIATLGLLQALSTVSYIAATRRIGPTRTALADTLQPVFAVALAAMVLGDRLSPMQLAGGLMILVGITVGVLPRTGPRPSRPGGWLWRRTFGTGSAAEPPDRPAGGPRRARPGRRALR